jgi:glucose-6-phosphate 1-epimerase
VVNTGRQAFEFNWLFHTYYKIPDITEAMVSNLVDQNVNDKIIKSRYQEKSPVIQFHGELDRVYEDVSESKLIQIIHQGKVLFNLERSGLPDAVVWNPWIEKAKGMGDFEPKDGYQNMVCVEPGYVSKFVKLDPSKQWSATQTMYTGGEIKIQSNIFQ